MDNPNFNHVREAAIDDRWNNLAAKTSSVEDVKKILGEDYDESEFSLESILEEFGSKKDAKEDSLKAEAPRKHDLDNPLEVKLDMTRSPFREEAPKDISEVASVEENANNSVNYPDLLQFMPEKGPDGTYQETHFSESSLSAAKAERIIAEIDHEIAKQEKALEEATGRMVYYEGIRDDIDEKLAPANTELQELEKDTEPSWKDYFNIIGSVAVELAREKFKRPENRDLTSFHERITSAFEVWNNNRAAINKNKEDYKELREQKVQNRERLDEIRADISEIEDRIASLKSEKAMHEGSKIILEAAGNEEEAEFFKQQEMQAAAIDLDGKSASEVSSDIEARRSDITDEYDDYIRKVDAQIALLTGPSFARADESSEDRALKEALEKRKAEVTKKYEQEMYKLDVKKNTYDRIFPGSRSEKSKGLLKKLNIKAALEAAKKRRLVNALNQYYGDLEA